MKQKQPTKEIMVTNSQSKQRSIIIDKQNKLINVMNYGEYK